MRFIPLIAASCPQRGKFSPADTGQLEPRLKREFEQHLSICPDCVNFLNSYKKTVALTGALEPTTLPAKVRNNVLDFLRKKMRRIATFLFCLASQFSG